MVALAVTALAAIGLADAACSGFRAATGRNALIDKRQYFVTALRRGLGLGGLVVGGVAVVVLSTLVAAADPGERYAEFARAGGRMLLWYGPFALLGLGTIAGSRVLRHRGATFLVLLGLGPMTLVRPLVALAGGVAAVVVTRDPAVRVCVALAVAGALAVEPYIHRRWYARL